MGFCGGAGDNWRIRRRCKSGDAMRVHCGIISHMMQPFTTLNAIVAPIDRADIDTDQIIPKQFLRSIQRAGFGPFLFDEWRYLDRGELGMDCTKRPQNPEFPLNLPQYQGAQILLTRDNFGCGSSREHAVWALMDYGFRAIIAPSFGDIFHNNAAKNGLLAVQLAAANIDALFALCAQQSPRLHVDLAAQTIAVADGDTFVFDIAADDKSRLLGGLDDIALTLRHQDKIQQYETWRRTQEPWLYE